LHKPGAPYMRWPTPTATLTVALDDGTTRAALFAFK
jgi:hypothetical protein